MNPADIKTGHSYRMKNGTVWVVHGLPSGDNEGNFLYTSNLSPCTDPWNSTFTDVSIPLPLFAADAVEEVKT